MKKIYAAPVLLLLASPLQAHHSVNGQFDTEDRVTVTGTVNRVDWVNPHVYVYLDVTNEDGSVTTWGLETAPTARLRQGGLTQLDLAGMPGEQVTALGMPARQDDNTSTWLTDDGSFHTENLRVIERLSRDGDTLHYQAIAHDPEILAQPWELRPRELVLSDWELEEPAPCVEKSLDSMVDRSVHHDNVR